MGFLKEIYSNNRAGLRVAFNDMESNSRYFDGDSVEAAMEYFKMYVKDESIFIKTEEEQALDNLGIKPEESIKIREFIDYIVPSLSDEQAVEYSILFPEWQSGVSYKIGDRVCWSDNLYKVLQDHFSQSDWTPDVAPSLFSIILTDEENNEIFEWVQPDSTNSYMKGDCVIHNGIIYESQADNNVWEPGVVGTESLWTVID